MDSMPDPRPTARPRASWTRRLLPATLVLVVAAALWWQGTQADEDRRRAAEASVTRLVVSLPAAGGEDALVSVLAALDPGTSGLALGNPALVPSLAGALADLDPNAPTTVRVTPRDASAPGIPEGVTDEARIEQSGRPRLVLHLLLVGDGPAIVVGFRRPGAITEAPGGSAPPAG